MITASKLIIVGGKRARQHMLDNDAARSLNLNTLLYIFPLTFIFILTVMPRYVCVMLDWFSFLRSTAIWVADVWSRTCCTLTTHGVALTACSLWRKEGISWKHRGSPRCPTLDIVLLSYTQTWQPHQCYPSCFDSAVFFNFSFSLNVWSVFLPLSCSFFANPCQTTLIRK